MRTVRYFSHNSQQVGLRLYLRLWAIVVAIAVASAKAPEPGVVMIATATWPSGVDITVPARMGTPLHLIM